MILNIVKYVPIKNYKILKHTQKKKDRLTTDEY